MTFGLENTTGEATVIRVRGAENVKPFLDTFAAYGHVEIDTARIYGRGDTEVVSLVNAVSYQEERKEGTRAS